MTQECFDFWNAHFRWVAFIMKQNVMADPLNVGFFLLAETLRERYDMSSILDKFGRQPALGASLKAFPWWMIFGKFRDIIPISRLFRKFRDTP
jgi:hypothetical protein